MEPAKKTGRRGPEQEGVQEEQPTGQPVNESIDKPAEKVTRGQKEVKVKVTYSLPVWLVSLIDVCASELRMESCDLVVALLGPKLKGCRRPTVSDEVRQAVTQNSKSAA